MRFLIILLLSFFCNFSYGQEVHSIYALTRKGIYDNKYKNYTEKDSIILFNNKTFKRFKNYYGFDEIDNESYFGTWNFYKKNLVLSLEKKLDSVSIQNADSLSTIIRPTFFIPRRTLKKYKRVK